MRPRAQRLAFEVKYEYIGHQFTNISTAGSLGLGKFPDNRLLMCEVAHRGVKARVCNFWPSPPSKIIWLAAPLQIAVTTWPA